jgi:4'-phosphopantetheinyl transferase
LLGWPGYDGPVRLLDLEAGQGYAAALAVLSDEPVDVRSTDAGPLLSS